MVGHALTVPVAIVSLLNQDRYVWRSVDNAPILAERHEPAIAERVAKGARQALSIDCGQPRNAEVFADKPDIGAEITTGARGASAGANPKQPIEVAPVLFDLLFALLTPFLAVLIRELPARSTSCTSRAGTSEQCQSLVSGTYSVLYECPHSGNDMSPPLRRGVAS